MFETLALRGGTEEYVRTQVCRAQEEAITVIRCDPAKGCNRGGVGGQIGQSQCSNLPLSQFVKDRTHELLATCRSAQEVTVIGCRARQERQAFRISFHSSQCCHPHESPKFISEDNERGERLRVCALYRLSPLERVEHFGAFHEPYQLVPWLPHNRIFPKTLQHYDLQSSP